MNVRSNLVRPVVVALAVAVGVAVLVWRPFTAPEPPRGGPDPDVTASLRPAAAGMRPFAVGNVVLDIPAHWAQSERSCRDRVTGSVVVDRREWRTCLALGRFAPSVHVVQTDQPSGRRYAESATVEVPALEGIPQPVFDGPARRTRILAGPDGVVRMALVVPADDHVFVAEARSAGLVRRIIGSARLLPHGTPVVPHTGLADGAGNGFWFPRSSGVEVRFRRVAHEYRPLVVVRTEPAPGTPLRPARRSRSPSRRGSTVRRSARGDSPAADGR